MKILVRLDDFTPNRDDQKWLAVEGVLDRLNIKPLVAVIPNDQYFGTAASTEAFWQRVREFHSKGWDIAIHGDTHAVVPIAAGTPHEIFFATKSEFVGLSVDAQLAMISNAWDEFSRQGVRPIAFVAPNHGFDARTVTALARHGRMPIISDGISYRPFRDRSLVWIPQIDWRIPRVHFGFRTVCLHPSTMTEAEIRNFGVAAQRVAERFVRLGDTQMDRVNDVGITDRIFASIFSTYFGLKTALHRAYTSRKRGVSSVVA